jgi:hypothetical protein
MTTQEWNYLKRHLHCYYTGYETYAGIVIGAILGVTMLEVIINYLSR